MPIPDYQTMMLPVLRIADKGEIHARDAANIIADEFGLSGQEREEVLPSGRQAKVESRVHWAVTYLTKAGLVQRPRRGYFAITPEGQDVLSNPPARIDNAFLKKSDKFCEFLSGTGSTPTALKPIEEALIDDKTPEERIETAFNHMNSALRDELLERILVMDPTAFEKLIVDLMLGMGYGENGSGERLGQTNDGGIDGVINEDVLGLDIIYLQAKRYATDKAIGPDRIREFAGALDERGASKGVFVTTSRFTSQAIQYGQRSPKSLVLIDGEELTGLLVRHGVAVRVYRVLELKKIDADYFDDDG